jgi:hypothetical protein
MVHFHEPQSTTLQRIAPGAGVKVVRDLHEITTFLVLFATPESQAQPS